VPLGETVYAAVVREKAMFSDLQCLLVTCRALCTFRTFSLWTGTNCLHSLDPWYDHRLYAFTVYRYAVSVHKAFLGFQFKKGMIVLKRSCK
jgi:hypothetical protein